MRYSLLALAVVMTPLMGQTHKELEKQKSQIFASMYKNRTFAETLDYTLSKPVIDEVRRARSLGEQKTDKEIAGMLFEASWPPFQNSILISRAYAGKWERQDTLLIRKSGEVFAASKLDNYFLCVLGRMEKPGGWKLAKAYLSLTPDPPSSFTE